MDCVCQRYHKECSIRTCADDSYYCWKSPNSSQLCDHGFMDVITTPIVRQSVNHKKSFKWFTNSIRITLKTIKNTPQSIKKTCYYINALINTTLLHQCSYTSEYNAKTRFSCIWFTDCLRIGVVITSMKPWSYKWLEFGLFQQYIHPLCPLCPCAHSLTVHAIMPMIRTFTCCVSHILVLILGEHCHSRRACWH